MDTYAFLNTNRLVRLADSVRNLFENSPSRAYLHHTFRTASYAAQIANSEQLDPEPVTAAALVHDIGMVLDSTFGGHVGQTSKLAPLLLIDSGFADQDALEISHIASSHHPAPGDVLNDARARALFDADCLEIVGVFGFLRWFGGIPKNLGELSSSSELFIDIVDTAVKVRGSFFYTRLAHHLGDMPLYESLRLCKALAEFVREAETGGTRLRPTPFAEALCAVDPLRERSDTSRQQRFRPVTCGKKILALCGLRCSGKGHVRRILADVFSLPVFDTDSVPTGDADSNGIPIDEILKRYGKGESYFHFLERQVREALESVEDVLIIDSVKARADRSVLEGFFPQAQVRLLWVHAPYNERETRYQNRDVQTGQRDEALSNHDRSLLDAGIFELCSDADFVVSNVFGEHKLEADLACVINALRLGQG